MHTRFSGRASPLAFDPEIERTARNNRVLHRAWLTSSSRGVNLNESSSSSSSSSHTHSIQASKMAAPQDQFPHGGYDDYDNNNNHEDYNDGYNEWDDYNNNEGYNEWNDGNYNDGPNGGNGGGYNNNNYQHVRGVDSHFRLTIMNNPSPIIPPQHQGQHFEICPQYLAIIPSFRGFASDEPYTHLQEFSAICSTIGSQGFTTDEVKLYLFQFSLKDKAKQWFTSLPSGSIRTWVEMQQIFLDEYYPMSKTSEARNAIKSFSQHVGEELHEAFTRFKEMLRICPHHDIPRWELVKIFYDGLIPKDRRFVYTSSGGTFLTHSEDYEWNFLERLSKGSKTQVSASRKVKLTAGVKSVGERVHNDRVESLERKLDMICKNMSGTSANVSQVYEGVVQKQEITDKTVGALAKQMGQLAEGVAIRDQGKLPSDTTVNPQHGSSSKNTRNVQINEVRTLRSGKVYKSGDDHPP
ncbi:hypothetical protein L1987_55735 [Smallanthus sonchifolius]|uniref:Uncharacterized protein n=1 Tax=Smallanthus sonchifolius TaxID=185202 RepID=A0ACB9EAQ0_9ASTR|nr:hypothetical protein L1987_55735 [Smallanthus sonchifolius]